MPRITKKSRALKDIDDCAQAIAVYIALSKSKTWKNIKTLLNIHTVIETNRYFSRSGAGRHEGLDIIDNIIYEFSNDRFLAMFRMSRSSFWQLVHILEDAGGAGYWDARIRGSGGRVPRPAYQQIAVALYTLGGAGTGRERSGVNLNIGHGTVGLYTWRSIQLLVKLSPDYIRWPTSQQRMDQEPPTSIFQRCIGFLDGSIMILRYKPVVDPQAYYYRKSNYGFNLQAICNWDRKFIWASMSHPASAHDSMVFKLTPLYRQIETVFNHDEYILADKAYALERHVIVPYKEPLASRPNYSAFNYALSIPRVKIEHTFGILKGRWPSLRDIPIRINEDAATGHRKVMHWVMSCLVLHNILASIQYEDNDTWLEESEEIEDSEEKDKQEVRNREPETEEVTKQAGIRLRQELVEKVCLQRR